MKEPPTDVTLMLKQLSSGDQNAVNRLVPVLYDELRRLAGYFLRKERSDHTLQATALVHEAYLRLVDQRKVEWKNRSHFFGVAAQVMRRILVDHARSHQAVKRGAAVPKLSLDEALDVCSEKSEELLALDELLTRLSVMDAQQARVVELRYFGGLSVEETAELIGVSTPTVKRDWAMAKAWLAYQLRARAGTEAGQRKQV
jgi:RNA polymerase sigma-70 factor, ECF subfamily